MNTPPNRTASESAPSKRHYNPTAPLFPDLEPPVVAAWLPAAGTRPNDALQALTEGPQNQADYWQGWRLAAYVKALEYDGWRFIKRNIIKPGCRRPITEYELDRTDPGTAAALESLQKGSIDATLAGLLAFGVICVLLVARWPV